MPYHTKEKKGTAKPKKKVQIKSKKKNVGMTQSQRDKFKEHAKKHSTKHINIMKKMVKGGTSFSKAHKVATKMVGN